MKVTHFVCLVFLLFVESSAQEQIKQGVYSLGGTISYSSTTMKTVTDETDNSIYSLAPSISYFFINQCELSFGVGYTVSSVKFNSPNSSYSNYENKNKSLALSLGIRFYFPVDKVAPFIGASGQISWSTPYYDSSQPFQSPSTGYAFTGGLEIFIAQSAAIEPSIVYSKIRYNEYVSRDGILVGIGIKYFIL